MSEKTIKIGKYQIFFSIVQVSNNMVDLLIYAQNDEAKRPYTKPKNIFLYKQAGDKLSNCFNVVDTEPVSRIRYIYQEPTKYVVKVRLETDTGPLIGEIECQLGSPPPNFIYLAILGILLVSVLGTVFYLRQKKNASNKIRPAQSPTD